MASNLPSISGGSLLSSIDIFLDESGYTGDDLLNGDQPIFTLASTILSDEEARDMFARHFPGAAARELKHSTLASRPRGQRCIVDFIEAVTRKDVVAVEIWHKEFTLMTTMVDSWIEESTRLHGINLYERGGNIGLSNLLYISFMSLLPYQQFRTHLARYQAMMRERTEAAYERFWGELRRLFDIADHTLRDTLIWLFGAEHDLGFAHLRSMPERVLNVTPSSLLVLAKHWKQKLGREMVFVHDKSRDLAREAWLWELILSPGVPATRVGYDRRSIDFPLGVKTIRFEDSQEHPALQAADLVAGAMSVVARNTIDPTYRPGYAQLLRQTALRGAIAGGVWPSEDVTPEDMETTASNAGGGDPADFIASLVSGRKSKSPPGSAGPASG